MPFVLGVDVGQSADYTTAVVIERIDPADRYEEKTSWTWGSFGPIKITDKRLVEPKGKEPVYAIRHAERWKDKPYPELVSLVVNRAKALPEPPLVALDATGCGRPVGDLFDAAHLNLCRILIHGGDTARYESPFWRVPKRDLVSIVQVALQNGTLKIAAGQEWTRLLTDELRAFRVVINPETSHDSYSAWRERDHDDLVLGAAVGLWAAAHRMRRVSFVKNPWNE